MKKIIDLTIAFSMLFCITTVNVKAVRKTTVTDDGITITYDNDAINEKVDLTPSEFVPNAELEILKTNSKQFRASSKELDIPFESQKNEYWCAPAAATMMLNTNGFSVSQKEMANAFGTKVEGTTAGYGISDALNEIVSGSGYYFTWEWHVAEDVSTLKEHTVEAINYGNPVLLNTYETANDIQIDGHDMGTDLYHFGLIGDYFDYGNSATYVDSGYGYFAGFKMNQRISMNKLSIAAGQRGYVW